MQANNKENISLDKLDHKEEFILDPTMSNFILLDKISRKLGMLLKIQEDQKKIQEDQKKIQEDQKKIQEDQKKIQENQQKSIDLRFSELLKTHENDQKTHENEQKIHENEQKSLYLRFGDLLKIQQSLDSRLETLSKIEAQNQMLLSSILEEQRAEADSGEFITKLDTVTTTKFALIDTTPDPGHPVKGYAVSNDGSNTIFVAHNAIVKGISPDTVDVTSDISRFQQILPGEEVRFIFNRRRVYNIAILARDGDSIYRLWLTW